MYFNSLRENECCGCTACQQICPQKCIEMKWNTEGFLYPELNYYKCINCHLCEKVCPIENRTRKKYPEICYYGWHLSEDKRLASTSGAAFVAIAEACHAEGYTCFYGAAYDENLHVHHIGITNIKDLAKLRCSKYVQSSMGDVYSEIRDRLKNGEYVLFSGTPCQVEGLENYVGNRENLFTVALVCHGVSSPIAFKTYLEEIGSKYGVQVKGVKFRDKRIDKNTGILSHKFTDLKLENGVHLVSAEDIYTISFGIGIMSRESCFSCPYTSPSGAGDITIGDFWGIEQYVPELKKEISKGISLLIPHTEKAWCLIPELKKRMKLEEVPVTYAINDNQEQLLAPMKRPEKRDVFLKRIFQKNGKFCKEAKREIFRWKVSMYKNKIYKKLEIMMEKSGYQ